MTPDQLESTWASLQPPSIPGAINGRRATGLPADKPVYLAVDARTRRHLLIQVADNTQPISQRDTRSLEVSTERFAVGANPEALYVALTCTDQAQFATFNAVAHDVIRDLNTSLLPMRDTILGTLTRWRSFWMARNSGLSREDAIGLFGELWFLRRWMGTINASKINRWQATQSARHDFQWPAASIEVKTSAVQSATPPVHRITSLEQLADPQQGQLFLFSLQISEDALAANTLHALVNNLTEAVRSDFAAASALNDKLVARGYSPDDRQFASRPFRILAERLYRLDASFPRLTRQTFHGTPLPAGISAVEYSLDLAACGQWLVATTPEDPAAKAVNQ